MNRNYELKSGIALRAAIDNGDPAEIIRRVEGCYRELLDEFFITEDDFDCWAGDLAAYGDNVTEDDVAYELASLYDLCGALMVLIPV